MLAFFFCRSAVSSFSRKCSADFVERGRRIGMHGHRRVAEHRFGARRGDRHVRRLARLGIDHRIFEVPEVALRRFVEHLIVAHGRLQKRVPIHQPFAAVDFAVFEQAEEPLAHGPGTLCRRA